MVEKTIEISGKEVKFRSSAAVPRLYRAKFKRDMFFACSTNKFRS